MPNYDKTGPLGEGAMTGRGTGSCSGKQQVGQGKRGFGQGRGVGCCGRGFRKNSQVMLQDQEKCLEKKLEDVRKLKNDPKN